MIRTAVILAAGRGTRLAGELTDRPKGFLELGARPIIEESLERLENAGITEAIIVTGHCRGHYDELASRRKGFVRTVHNERFADSGSLYSLHCARDAVNGDFLLLESDLIYESRALETLLESGAEDAVLLSGPTGAGDEVWVQAEDGCLVGMSKERDSLDSVTGELVGISRISAALAARLFAIAETLFARSLRYDYETDGLVAAARERCIACPLVEDLVWAEIDDPSHLARARTTVYPRLCGRDAAAR